MFLGWHGDSPCTKCAGPIKRAATHHGMCAQHYLGATETERAIARFNDQCDREEDTMILQLHAELEAYGREAT